MLGATTYAFEVWHVRRRPPVSPTLSDPPRPPALRRTAPASALVELRRGGRARELCVGTEPLLDALCSITSSTNRRAHACSRDRLSRKALVAAKVLLTRWGRRLRSPPLPGLWPATQALHALICACWAPVLRGRVPSESCGCSQMIDRLCHQFQERYNHA